MADPWRPRLASVADADEIARLLHDFNSEFATPSPGVDVLVTRLGALLPRDETFAVLAGTPAVAVALVTLRPNVWYAGPVALLDELYVVPHVRNRGIGSAVIEHLLLLVRTLGVELLEVNVDEGDVDARRFYERLGFATCQASGSDERSFYYAQEITGTAPRRAR